MSGMNNDDIPIRIATYSRISQKGQSNGIATQNEQIAKFLKDKGWPPPVLHYQDEMTARKDPRKDPRPGHAKMKLDAMTHQFDTIVIYRLDRLARSVKNAAEWLDICREGKIRLVLVGDGMVLDHSPMGLLMFHMLAIMAQFFADMQEANRKAGQEKRWATNNWNKGGRPIKYENREEILNFLEAGHTWAETTEEFGISRTRLGVLLKERRERRAAALAEQAASEAENE